MHYDIFPKIRKAELIGGKNIFLRNANLKDSEFIISLRTDPIKSLHINRTSSDIDLQIKWLQSYETDINQAYFIIFLKSGEPIGTIRIYDQQQFSFCWGSWILKNGSPKSSALESMLVIYSYSVDFLGFKHSHFDVRQDNEKVWRFHERLGAVRVGITDDDYLYEMSLDKIRSAQQRYTNFLPLPIRVEYRNEY